MRICSIPKLVITQRLLHNKFIILIFIYLLKSLIYIEYNTNSGYKWTPQEVIDLYML